MFYSFAWSFDGTRIQWKGIDFQSDRRSEFVLATTAVDTYICLKPMITT